MTSSFPDIGFIGAGRLARTLAPLLDQAGYTVIGACSRNRTSTEKLAAACSAAKVFDAPDDLIHGCQLIFVTVPDDTIQAVAEEGDWQPGQCVVHCSGATEIAALDAAARKGALTGGFHPLQIFSDPDGARERVRGSTVAIEAGNGLQQLLEDMAHRLQMRTLHLPAGARVAYHLAGNFAASAMLALLKEAEDLWQQAGLPREAALPALLPLTQGTLDTAIQVGLASAVSGPVSRGDTITLEKHLRCAGKTSAGATLYREILRRLLDLASRNGRMNEPQYRRLHEMITPSSPPAGNDPE